MKLENETRGGRASSSASEQQQQLQCQLPADGTVIKMKGLPFKATEAEIKEFFNCYKLQDIPHDGVYMKKHADGRPNGEAFVVFESHISADSARGLDKKQFNEVKYGDRFVRVYPMLAADLPELQRAMVHKVNNPDWSSGNSTSSQHQHDSVVRVKSLPFDANQADLLDFFRNYHMKPNGVQLVVRLDGRPTGEAFVDFESYEEALRASRDKDRQVFHPKFGERYVRLILVTRQEMQRVLAERYAGEGILKMKGLPFQCTFAEVRCFFAGYRIKVGGINFVMHADGRPTGMAFIEFESVHEAIRAMEKDKARFGPEYGDRFVMLSQSSRADMDKQILKNESEEAGALLGSTSDGASAAGGMGNLSWLLPPLLMAGAAGQTGHVGLNALQGTHLNGLANLQQMFGAMSLNPATFNLNNAAGLLGGANNVNGIIPLNAASNGLLSSGSTAALPMPGQHMSLQDLGAAWMSQNMDPSFCNLLQTLQSSGHTANEVVNGNSNSNGNTNESGSWESSMNGGLLQGSNLDPASGSQSDFARRYQNGGSRRSSFESSTGNQNANSSGNSNGNGGNDSFYSTSLPFSVPQENGYCNLAANGLDTTHNVNIPQSTAVNGNAAFIPLPNGNAHGNMGTSPLVDPNANVNNNAFVMNQLAQQSALYNPNMSQQQPTWGGLSLS
eukprot:TRINITY_DN1331_c0_g1_i10.p1 TRINITY_DN1331_c0_g1~~TRINITY_DN1331_c0_g1_i10.p1  ORF type:complete len:672 (-),score=115.69 TRINITY_DN1331_c0_g1_i10:5362-7377(-)